jgi:putative RNase toxin 21 of polymorphic toxin system
MSEGIFPDLGGDDISADSTVIPCPQDWVERVKNGIRGNGFKTDAEIEKERQEEQRKLAQEAYKAAEWLKKNGADPRQLDQLNNQQVIDLYNAVQRGDSSVTTGGVTINIQPIQPGRPALEDDPYHPKNVEKRQRTDLTKLRHVIQSEQRAAERLGFNRVVKDAPFNSHGQKVYTDGSRYITRDVDSHSGGVWKMFDRRGNRLGTFDANLNRIGK